MLKHITFHALRHFRIAGCLFVLNCLLTSAGHAQGWITPLERGYGGHLQKTPDGTYIVALEKQNSCKLFHLDSQGELIGSISFNTLGGEHLERFQSFNIIGDSLYFITLSYIPPDFTEHRTSIYKTNWSNFSEFEVIFQTHSEDTVITKIVKDSTENVLWGYTIGNCLGLFKLNNGQLSNYVPSCFGTVLSGDGVRFWAWNNKYLTTIGESRWVYSNIGSNTVDSVIIGNCNKFLNPSYNGDYMGGLSSVFKLVDTNFQIVNELSDADLSYANVPNTQVRDGLCSASDGGFYYAAHYNNWSFPTIYLGKIDALGNHAWIRAYPEYIFAAVRGITEAVEGDGAVMLVEDEYYTSENTNLYLMKTAADGTIGTEEHFETTFQVFPNPAQESIQILSSIPGDYTLTIFNALGQEIRTQFLTESHALIDISSFPVGIYTLQLVQDNQTRFAKFIKG